jgi:hypothetical protein
MKTSGANSHINMELQSGVLETFFAFIVIMTAHHVTYHNNPDDGGRNNFRNVGLSPRTTADRREVLIAYYMELFSVFTAFTL